MINNTMIERGMLGEQPISDWNFFSFLQSEEAQVKSRFQSHTKTLIWKCYLQRQRRWRVLLLQCFFGLSLFVISVLVAKPVFLTPIQATPQDPITSTQLLSSVKNTILGYAPNDNPYNIIIATASTKLNTQFLEGTSEDDLNNQLYINAQGKTVDKTIIWIIFKPEQNNFWRFSIKSTDRLISAAEDCEQSFHSKVFLGVQMAVSQAILEYAAPQAIFNYEITLTAMPVSPLMQNSAVRIAISGILMCYTLALLPPVIEAQALVVHETQSKFKQALLMRKVSYSSVYIAWLVYAYLTVFPICVMGAIVLILIFRWIHLLYALMTLMSYVSVMIMFAFIMAMFHNTALISCLWSTLFTMLQTFLAELLVHHGFDKWNETVSFLLHIFIPPLGLIHAFNQFALLQTGNKLDDRWSIVYTVLIWTVMNMLYFALLMLLQRTIGQERAIGGQVSWKSIIFKKIEDKNVIQPVPRPTGKERQNLQEVDQLMAKAISFRNVSKSIMNVKVLDNVTLDIYRGEYTMLFAERIQARMVNTCEDLVTGLAIADEGTINILGKDVTEESNLMSAQNMMGYCHRSMFLVDDLTVEEHLEFFIKICLWNETKHFITEYSHLRFKRLMAECYLENVKHVHIENLNMFFRAQLCWAIAVLLEPRIVIIPDYGDPHSYISVIRDKIMQFKKYMTIVKISYATVHMVTADRIFVFDNKILVFGGTPAYMFFKYGREYRVRLTFRGGGSFDNERVHELVANATRHGATVRANLGSLIILRMPTNPTANVAALVQEIQDRSVYYGVSSFSISLPDSEEICRRAINVIRGSQKQHTSSSEALKQFVGRSPWKKRRNFFLTFDDMRSIGWKYFSFCVYYRLYFIFTVMLAITAGILIGMSLSTMLTDMQKDHASISSKLLHGDILTVESLQQTTTLILRVDTAVASRSIAASYVISETNATVSQTKEITYTALMSNENLVEYLITRAIDSPQQYVYMYVYGLNVTEENNNLSLHVLFSPMHKDKGAAARSLARLYMALIRHYTNKPDATIQVTDDPLSLDFTPFLKYAGSPPLVIMFLLIVTMSHVTLIPSKEHGLIKHLQSHAYNFSPLQYWTSLYFCDLILYWLLVSFIALAVVCVMYISVPADHFRYSDLLVVPFILIIYGMACVPQSYLFCRGPRAALNAMSFVIINLIFGEATVVAKMFFDLENVLLYFMRMWPQFNTGFAIVKIKQIFLYNSECIIFETENLCSSKTLHKCCKKCGLLEQCYTQRRYLTTDGILGEVHSMLIMTAVFLVFLLLWEYKIMQLSWSYVQTLIKGVEMDQDDRLSPGSMREKGEVLDKLREIQHGRSEKINTFGESLLCANLTEKRLGEYVLRNVYLGLGRGEALAISGLKKHGRVALIETLAGLNIPSCGQLWAKSKYKLNSTPHQYCRQVSIGCERDPLPLWMTVYDALEMIAILRGIPARYVSHEIWKFIHALELYPVADTLICHIPGTERTRINFAAAVIGSPPVIIIDECTNFQEYSICRAMYFILYQMKRKGHAIFISSHSIESHMPMTNRLGILLDGRIVDVDLVDNLIARYTLKGYTVVVHLKDEVDVEKMFGAHFKEFVVNDTTDVLVNVQVLDSDLNWKTVFEKMEELQASNSQVYSYIVTSIPIDYIYNSIIVNEIGLKQTSGDLFTCPWLSKLCGPEPKIHPTQAMLDSLIPFPIKYEITKLQELPWSVIFHR
ncbi:ATP-binding cassette sub-family A member 17-like [Plodia interpunctella]|uniref:ATP-binding cassette sub-family A member 17-like n=1 Tax=Plodia interpunctella TaxID=58824 RepID=UPI002368CF67|nr:ATP-binding cassette sub-family A member 17-like [Plodia interpunctella]